MCDKIELILTFNDIDELNDFVKDYRNSKDLRLKKMTKKEDDKRGSTTKLLHSKAREVQIEDPLLSYKQCLRIAGSHLKKNSIVCNDLLYV